MYWKIDILNVNTFQYYLKEKRSKRRDPPASVFIQSCSENGKKRLSVKNKQHSRERFTK